MASSEKTKPKLIDTLLDKRKNINKKTLLIIVFFTGVVFIFATYAWLSASLNVQVKKFDMKVSSDSGLFISIDGIEYSETVSISINSIINDLRTVYPSNTNQWASGGLWPVSSNGIKNSDNNKFSVFSGEVGKEKGNISNAKKYLNTRLIKEDRSNATNQFMAFDIFLKNVSGSPLSDNLYFNSDTFIDFTEDTHDDNKESMLGIINSFRIGIIKMASVNLKADTNTVQNLGCNNNCQMLIYEPNSLNHSAVSIEKAQPLGIELIDGIYRPTYAVIAEGVKLQHTNGQEGTGIPLDTAHFASQNTIKDFDNPIYQIPSGITKMRVYIWLEGQDVDSLETNSVGASINISIGLIKDLAGYE